MSTYDLPEDLLRIVSWATQDVYRDQDSFDWNPSQLREPCLTVWAVEQAQGIIDNGGFQYFFERDWPDCISYSVFINAFRRIGADEAADCLVDAVEMFPSETPQLDSEMRKQYMSALRRREGLPDSIMDKLGFRVMDLGEDTFRRLAAYILECAAFFPTVQRNSGR